MKHEKFMFMKCDSVKGSHYFIYSKIYQSGQFDMKVSAYKVILN